MQLLTQLLQFIQLHPVVPKVLGAVLLLHGLSGLTYLLPAVILRRPVPLGPVYLFSPLNFVWHPIMELIRPPWWRRKWLERSGVRDGSEVLEEGFGFGTSPMIAARMAGPQGQVYALDLSPASVIALWLRAKLYRLRNLRVIFGDAKHTGLPDSSVDVVFIADAFHEFPDKPGTLRELHRVLRAGGTLAVLEDTAGATKKAAALVQESGLFALEERDGNYARFRKEASVIDPLPEQGWVAQAGRSSRSTRTRTPV